MSSPLKPADLTTTAAVPAGFVDHDHRCVRCGYSLQGLPREGRCPECGSPVEMSIRGFYLAFAAPEYLATVRSGVTLVLSGILSTLGAYLLILVLLIVTAATGNNHPLLKVAIQGVALIPAAMLVIGYWKFTEPDPGFLGHEVPTAARKVIRLTVCIGAGSALLSTLAEITSAAASGRAGSSAGNPAVDAAVRSVLGLAGIASFAAWAVQFFAVMRYARWFGWRIPDRLLMKKTQTSTWLLPLVFILGAPLLLLGPFLAVILYWNLLNRLRIQFRAIQLTGLPSRFL